MPDAGEPGSERQPAWASLGSKPSPHAASGDIVRSNASRARKPPLKQSGVSQSCDLSVHSGTNTPESDPLPTSGPGDSERSKAWSLPKEIIAKIKCRDTSALGADEAWLPNSGGGRAHLAEWGRTCPLSRWCGPSWEGRAGEGGGGIAGKGPESVRGQKYEQAAGKSSDRG